MGARLTDGTGVIGTRQSLNNFIIELNETTVWKYTKMHLFFCKYSIH